MRALIVHPQLELYGGAETVVVHLTRYLVSKGIDTRILTLCTTDHPEYAGLNIIVPEGAMGYKIRGGRFSHSFEILKLISALKRLVNDHIADCDIVNSHNFPATWAAGNTKPVVWQANEFPDLWHSQNPSLTLRAVVALGRRWDRRVVRKNVDRAVVPDESQARKFKERYGFTPDIIPYGIEYELFAQGNGKQAARLYGLDGSFTVLHTGMISPSKNQLESVQAVEQLRKQVPNIRLVLAGFLDGNDYEQTLRGYVRDHALEHHVVFTGHISKNTLADLYHACNVAVYPVKGQGSWLSPFEVLCAAKPVIVSPSLSSSGIIAEKRIGQVSEDLTRAILNVHENPDLHGEMAQQGRRFVAENLTWEQYSERMLELFQSVLPG